jgi:hypothetical protein
MTIQHCWSDAWLLHAALLADAEGDNTLGCVVGCGDATQHAIFTITELQYGVARLQTAGWLLLADDRLVPTQAARDAWSLMKASQLSIRQQEARLQSLLRVVRQQPYDPNQPDSSVAPAPISPEQLADAVSACRQAFGRLLPEPGKKL